MRQTLFHIPESIGPLPVFGLNGWASILWAIFCVALVIWLTRRQGLSRETQGYLPILIIIWAALAFLAPRLVEEGYGIPIRSYGVLMLVGIVAGVALAVYRARQMGVDPEIIFSLAFVLFITAIIGARSFYVIQNWNEQFKKETLRETIFEVMKVTEGGLVVYGALIAGLLGAIWFFRRNKLPLLAMGDLIAPSMLVGLAIGRIGCLMNGCCWGAMCEKPWAITFPFASPPYYQQLDKQQVPPLGIVLEERQVTSDEEPDSVVIIRSIDPRGVAHGKGLAVGAPLLRIDGVEVKSLDQAYRTLHQPRSSLSIEQKGQDTITFALPRSKPVHPAQLYSTINATLLAALLWVAYPFRRRDGAIIALLLTLYPITRFLIEIIRSDEPGRFGTGMTISQLVSLGIFGVAIALWLYILRKPAAVALPGKQPLRLATAE